MINVIGGNEQEKRLLINELTGKYITQCDTNKTIKKNGLSFAIDDNYKKMDIVLYLTDFTRINTLRSYAKTNKVKIIVIVIDTDVNRIDNYLKMKKPKNIIDYVLVRNKCNIKYKICRKCFHKNEEQYMCCVKCTGIYLSDNLGSGIDVCPYCVSPTINKYNKWQCCNNECLYSKKYNDGNISFGHDKIWKLLKNYIKHKKFIIQLKRKDFIDIKLIIKNN